MITLGELFRQFAGRHQRFDPPRVMVLGPDLLAFEQIGNTPISISTIWLPRRVSVLFCYKFQDAAT
jgi:hypothetical protein